MEIINNDKPEIVKKHIGRPKGSLNKKTIEKGETEKIEKIQRDKPGRPVGSLNKQYKYGKVDGKVVYPVYTSPRTKYIPCSECGRDVKEYCMTSHKKSERCKYISENKKLKI